MKRTYRRAAVLTIALSALLVAGSLAAGSALGCNGGGEGEQHLVKSELTLSADATQVVAGQMVTLSGMLTAEETGTAHEGCVGHDCDSVAAPSIRPVACLGQGELGEGLGNDGEEGDECDRGQEDSDTPIAGATVVIYQSVGGVCRSWLATLTTADDGTFSTTTIVSADATFSAKFAGDAMYRCSKSHRVPVTVFAAPTAPVAVGRPFGGAAFVVRGKGTRGAGRITVTVYRRVSGHLVRVRSAVASFRRGTYTARLKLGAGTYVARATQASSARIHKGSSRLRRLAVNKR